MSLSNHVPAVSERQEYTQIKAPADPGIQYLPDNPGNSIYDIILVIQYELTADYYLKYIFSIRNYMALLKKP